MQSEDKLKQLIAEHSNLINRIVNLRTCTASNNKMNTNIQINNKSGITGVFYYKKMNKWRAQIQVDRKCICIGHYDSKIEASKARKEAEKKYFGEFRFKRGLTC